MWQQGYGMTTGATRDHGDADGDGDVDGRDYMAWQQQVTTAEPLSSVEAVSVPEPTAAWAAAMMLVHSLLSRAMVR
jgi:hypothetical protein